MRAQRGCLFSSTTLRLIPYLGRSSTANLSGPMGFVGFSIESERGERNGKGGTEVPNDDIS
ncbi:hypothetical protein [Aliiroseovarius sp. F20344]|uniref:hypothetical protein n=1 Tax=Aliiroseovarius sp. F20344 TaxID=2926414 RepID=UPI001FF5A786|nr:hypothetical protein [Aliiroseovarius sp. F20344]MCK0140961.1 hypothetical protein [Aliiroseovarius sp. F20344]